MWRRGLRILHVAIEIGDGVFYDLEVYGIGAVGPVGVALDEDESVFVVIEGFPLHIFAGFLEKLVIQSEDRLMGVAVARLNEDGGLDGVDAPHGDRHVDAATQFFDSFALHLFGVLFHSLRRRWR